LFEPAQLAGESQRKPKGYKHEKKDTKEGELEGD
jgi:hypothetical protein